MASGCPWCGKVLPVAQLLGQTGVCPGCRGRIRMPTTPTGRIEGLVPPPGTSARAPMDDEAPDHTPLEIDELPPEPRKPAAETPRGPAADGPMPGDSNWRPYLSSEQRTRPTTARVGAGLGFIVLITIVCLRVSCMGASRAARSTSALPPASQAPAGSIDTREANSASDGNTAPVLRSTAAMSR
ncbi:MAG: hypothetical protein IT452_03810 [Planctomycetia bacterium]|nr:hypothetical protein [Planctomycetia bacterium]